MSKITIIEPNSSDKDNVRNYMVKGEKGDPGVSPTFEVSKEDGTATIVITDAEGTHSVQLSDGELTKAMVKNNLTSNNTDLPLSAYQGKVLKDLVDAKANSNDVYNKTDSDNKYVANSNISVLTGSASTDENGLLEIDTSIFTPSNSTILSVMISYDNQNFKMIPSINYSVEGVEIGSEFYSFVVDTNAEYGINFNSNGLSIIFDYEAIRTIYYKIVLLKIS